MKKNGVRKPLLMFTPMSKSFAAVNSDEVTSSKLKEADGTSGQSTNSGSGVKTGHIQDGAVTAAKLGIVCPDGQYLKYTAGSGWACNVGTPGLQGPQGIAGPQGPQGVKGDTGLTGLQCQVGPSPHYANSTVVAISGGDYADPVTAINNLASWCGTPSATNPCLIKVMPGIYNIGGNFLTTTSYLDLEGSVENVTRVVGNEGSFSPMINVAANSEVRFITAENTGGGDSAFAIGGAGKISNVTALSMGQPGRTYGVVCSSCTLNNVTARGIQAGIWAYGTPVIRNINTWGVVFGILISSGSVTLENVTASSSDNSTYLSYGVGIMIDPTASYSPISVVLKNVTATGSGNGNSTGYGVDVSSYPGYINSPVTVTIDHSNISGISNSLITSGTTTVYVGKTKLSGGSVANNGGALACVGSYNGNYQQLNGSCQ